MRALALVFLLAPSAALADDIEVGVASVVRAELTTQARPFSIERAACSLGAHAQIGGQDRPIEIRVDYQGKIVVCPSSGQNPLTLAIRIDEPQEHQFHVVASTDAPAGTSAETVKELQETVHDTTAEIARRAIMVQPLPPEKPPEVHARPTRAYAPGLTVTGIVLGALGIGAAVAGYVWFLSLPVTTLSTGATTIDYGPPVALMLAGGGSVLLGALFAWVGEHRVPVE